MGLIKILHPLRIKNLAYDKNKKPNIWFYEMDLLGFNYRITDLQAGLGASQLTKINTFTKKRNQIAKIYNDSFKNIKNLTTPLKKENVYHTYHLYTILLNFKKLNISKNQLMKNLYKQKIGTQVLYIPVFLQPYYKNKYNFKNKDFPVSMEYYEQALSIPIFYDLKNEQIKIIKNIIRSIDKYN